jgi:tight adherence protein B
MTSALVAAGLAALASALALGPGRTALPAYDGPGGGRAGPPLALAVVAVVVVGAAVALLDGTDLVVALIGLGAAAGLGQGWRRRRAQRLGEARRARVVEVGEAMVGELRAGQPPGSALARAAEVWPELAPVVAAARLGADVPAAFRDRARLPGAEGLADLAAAWQVSERSGAALTTSLGQVVESARARGLASHLVAGELSSARATARLVAALPLGTLAMSAGIGGDPWSFLLGHPVGLVCLAAGVALVLAGLAWIDRIAGSVVRR